MDIDDITIGRILNQDTTNATDSVYNTAGANGALAGSQLLLTVARAASGTGYAGTFSIGLQID